MSDSTLLIPSVALRLVESGTSAWWLITVPAGEELAVANELQEELQGLGRSVRTWPGEPLRADVNLWLVTEDAMKLLPPRLEALRSKLSSLGVIAFIIEEHRSGIFLRSTPHISSFIGGKIVATSSEEPDAPREFIERRLASLRRIYGISDQEARERFESGLAPEFLDFTEWMVLLGQSQERTDDEP